MKRKPILGIITNNRTGVFQRNVLHGVKQVADERGYEVLIDARTEASNTPLDVNNVAGVLVIANPVPNEYLKTLYENEIPLSLVSHQVEGLPIPALISNNVQGMATLTRHLIECGRRNFVFIRGYPDQNDGLQRENAFRRELMRYNLDVPEHRFLQGDFDPEIAAEALQGLIAYDTDFDAVLAADFLMAKSAIQVLREAGIDVPHEVSVVGFGDGPEAAAAGITTVAADVVELGRRSARQLIGQVEGLRIRGTTVLSVELILRDTCNAPPKLRARYQQRDSRPDPSLL